MAKIRGTIAVDTECCKGCKVCVVVCPTKAIDLGHDVNSKGYSYMQLVYPENCTGCTSCAAVCPDSCIAVYRVKAD
jgi:2-oxoglutarate ferredoxin oxidoreductase subunit delta